MVLVYSDKKSSRLEYILEVIFRDVLNDSFILVSDLNSLSEYDGPKINYSEKMIPACLQIIPHSLLFESGISPQQIEMAEWHKLPVFFMTSEDASLPFDIFALSFYLISRYEEYLPFTADTHGRFSPEQSLAYKEKFLDIPLVNLLVFEMIDLLVAIFPDFKPAKHTFTFSPSVDIDIAFAHKGKSFVRALGAAGKLISKADFQQLKERWKVLLGSLPDPYDNFEFQLQLCRDAGLKPLYFILIGDYGKFDKNLSHRSGKFRRLIKELSKSAEVGIHPSYQSFNDAKIFKKELARLHLIIEAKVVRSRQHFLRLGFPGTYRSLIDAGIMHDYSMGYASALGFRASIASVYSFYDLEEESKTGLRLHPFFFMDTAMIDHLHMTPEAALNNITPTLKMISESGGYACGVWHNYALSEQGIYKNWQGFYNKTIEAVKEIINSNK